jgi:signal transduction histidine kinase
MLLFIRNYILQKPDEQLLSWLFPYSKKATLSGLVFLFITFTALSLVDRCYFAAEYYAGLPHPIPTPFGFDSFFRLVFVPLFNLGAIAYVHWWHNDSNKRLTNTSVIVLLLTMASLVLTGLVHEYYSANDYTYEVEALIVYTMTMFGLPFRTSFLVSMLMFASGLAFLVWDRVEEKVFIYNMTFMSAIWVAMIVGAYRKSELRRENFKAFTLVRNSAIELDAKARELSQRNHELQQFAYASSHDLQEPLRTISNFVAILEKRLANQISGDLKTYLGFISKSTERMKHLIHAILEYSHIGRNVQLAQISCDEALRQVMADLDYAITQSNASIQVGKLPNITAYSTEFSMLMQNLLGNAIKFSKKDVPPIIKISVKEMENEYRFSVADNGIGMEPKHAERVFDLFGRLHTKDEYEGTGIGLAHCKKIVDLHGGRIWVESLPGKGSTFYFMISKSLNTIISNDITA